MHLSRDMRFPTMWYLQPAKPHISLHICAVLSEPLLVAWIFYDTCLTAADTHQVIYVSDCRSRGHKFDPGPVPYFLGDRSWNNFYCHSPPSADSKRVVVSYKRKYVHKVLANCLVKLAQERSVVSWTDCADMTIADDWDVTNQTNPKKKIVTG